MRLVVLAGAGTSIELGVPGMEGLAKEFRTHVRQWDIQPTLVDLLIGETNDVEVLIERVDQLSAARTTLLQLNQGDPRVDAVDVVRAELEWFVQHAAERVVPSEAHLLWGGVLRAGRDHDVVFVTTNYDRAIELAANAEEIKLNDGFESLAKQEVAQWQGFAGREPGEPLLLKLHGSTDWYADRATGSPLKLRHPMPLFGRATLSLPEGRDLGSSLVLPSREKILNRSPFPRLSQMFHDAMDRAEAVIVVGSSLRDNHLRDAVRSVAETRPVYLVGPHPMPVESSVVRPIRQCASEFLISTLPAAMAARSFVGVMDEASAALRAPNSVLHLLKRACDPGGERLRRCEAIEQLAESGIKLPSSQIGRLINDADATVACYALALVDLAVDQSEVLKCASQCPHASNPFFVEELALLNRLLADELSDR